MPKGSVSPIAALIIGLLLTALFYPTIFADLFTNNNDIGGGGYWLILVLPAHCVISVVATAILYAVSHIVKHYGKKMKSMDDIITINSPTKGIMRVRVEQKKSGEIKYTLLDGISAEYGFSSIRTIAVSCPYRNPLIIAIYKLIMRKRHKTLPLISQEEMYNAAKDFIEQLGPSGYLDDGP